MTPKYYTKFVRQALEKKSGVSGSNLKRAVGANSKLVTSPSYSTMNEDEIKKDISQFNQNQAEKRKSMVSHIDIKNIADELQQEYYKNQAKEKEGRFRKSELKREKALNNRDKRNQAMDELQEGLRHKRDEEQNQLEEKEEQKKKNIKQAIKQDIQEEELEDMAID